MVWVRFTDKFDYHVPGKPVTIAYKAGQVKNVTTPCAKMATGSGKAVAATRDQQNEAPRKDR